MVDEELDEKVDEEVEEEVDTISTAKPVGGVRRGRDAASHPRLACPMLQLCSAQLCTMHHAPTMPRNYARCASTILGL